jgi:PTH1 family peptidyl-tRNA hydrolase
VLDVLATRAGLAFKAVKGRRADAAEGRLDGHRVILAKPTSFMNESGGPVANLLQWAKVPLEQLIVVHDELDLDLGRLKLKRGGGHGGNNGVRDVAKAVGPDFLRVRVGIGRPPGRQDPADYVLKEFTATERDEAGVVVQEAADAVVALLGEPLETAQNRWH